MANVVLHYLSVENIKKLLTDAGVVSSRTMHGRRGREVHCQNVLDMKKCCASEWAKDEAKAIEYGVVDFSKQNETGRYGVRRDLTEEEIEDLHFWPITFQSDDVMVWECCWKENIDPAFFISKLFPDMDFHLEMYYEGTLDGAYTGKDGNFVATEAWKTHVESKRKKDVKPSEDFVADIPF